MSRFSERKNNLLHNMFLLLHISLCTAKWLEMNFYRLFFWCALVPFVKFLLANEKPCFENLHLLVHSCYKQFALLKMSELFSCQDRIEKCSLAITFCSKNGFEQLKYKLTEFWNGMFAFREVPVLQTVGELTRHAIEEASMSVKR